MEINSYASDQTVFAGTSVGGVFRSIDGGVTWTAVNTGLHRRVTMSSLAISPDMALYAGTDRGGVYKSTDGGETWILEGLDTPEGEVRSIVISKKNFVPDPIIFVGTKIGIYKLQYKWLYQNWFWVLLHRDDVMALAISPNYSRDQTIFAGTYNGGIYKSTDDGSTWLAINTGLGDLYVTSLAISPGYVTDQTIFAGTSMGGIFKSIDGGATWTSVNTELSNHDVISLDISPNYVVDQTIFAGINGIGVFKSTDGGITWAAVNSGLSDLDVTSIAISPDYAMDQTLFSGTDSGRIFKSMDGGFNWIVVNSGLTNENVLNLAISPRFSCDGLLFAGTFLSSVWKYIDTEAIAKCWAPKVVTSSASSIEATGATLNGSVNPRGLATTAWFDWGTSSTLSTFIQTPDQSIGTGMTSLSINAPLSGLNPNSTYYYRLAASNSSGTTRGSVLSFTTLQTFDLTVNKLGAGTGKITSSSAGIDCGTDCSETYNNGTVVTLTATPAIGSSFAGWSGDLDCSDGVVTVDAEKTCTATFTIHQHTLTITKAGTGSGVLTTRPAGVDCGVDCAEVYDYGTVVELTAVSETGSSFAGWSGDLDCSDGVVTVDADKTCTATFTLQNFTLTVSVTGGGTVTSNPSGINCPGDCSESYTSGTLVNLTATSDGDYDFSEWDGDCKSAKCSLTMDENKSVTGTFTPVRDFTLSTAGSSSLTIERGSTEVIVYTVTSINDFNSAVTLSLSGEPSGITWSFDPNPLTPPANGLANSILTITVVNSVDCDTYPLSITGTSESLIHDATLNIKVIGCEGLRGEYYSNGDLTELGLIRIDPVIDFDWGSGSPDPAIGADLFSIRWTGKLQIDFNEAYTFNAVTDDGVRLWIDGYLVIDYWQTGAASNNGTMALTAGLHDIKIEYFEDTGAASAQLYWSSPSTPYNLIPNDHLYPPDGVGSAPVLEWAGDTGYASDGLDPETGDTATVFTYRVKYLDADGDAPMSGYPRLHILKNGQEISGSPFAMSFESGSYTDGAIYVYSTTLPGGTDYSYYFDARDTNGRQAVAVPMAPIPTVPFNAPDVGEMVMKSGDLDGSGRVDGFDLGRLGLAFGSRSGDANWDPNCDLNEDGIVDGSDLTILGSNFGKTM